MFYLILNNFQTHFFNGFYQALYFLVLRKAQIHKALIETTTFSKFSKIIKNKVIGMCKAWVMKGLFKMCKVCWVKIA